MANTTPRITPQQIDRVLDDVFARWSPASRPVVDDAGHLNDGQAWEPARLESVEAFRTQCEAWRDAGAEAIGTDRNQAIGHIETALGSNGSRALAEAMFETLTARGHLRYSAAEQAFLLDPIDDRDWLRLLEEADATLPVITPTGAYIEEHRRGALSAVVVVSVHAGDEDAGEVWLHVGVPPESEGTVRALGGPDVMGAEVYRRVWPFGDSWSAWVPEQLQDRSSGDILNAEVRLAALRAWREHECDEECDQVA